MVDDSFCFGIYSFRSFDYLYSELSSCTIYLYPVLKMIKIFKKVNKYIRFGINILVKLLLCIIYFVLFFPFFIFIKLFTDFLDIKLCNFPHWSGHNEIKEKEIEEFLRKQ